MSWMLFFLSMLNFIRKTPQELDFVSDFWGILQIRSPSYCCLYYFPYLDHIF